MKANPNLDELLCSFMDGELSPRQQMEVQRMAAHDPEVAQRLRQLRNCRTLLAALPPAEAPGDMLEQVRQSLERRTLLPEQPVGTWHSAGAWHLVFRKFVAAAAMIALLGVLGLVVYQIVAPVPDAGTSPFAADVPRPAPAAPDRTAVSPTMVADAGLSGRLELRTAASIQTDTFLRRAIGNSGLSTSVEFDPAGGQRMYRLTGTRAGVNRLVASLSSVWPNFQNATLRVDRPGAEAPVIVDAVTPEQAFSIVAQTSTEDSVEAAQAYAAMNEILRNTPGGEILPLIYEDTGSLLALANIPMPKMTHEPNDPKRTPLAPQGEVNASLTIVLLSTK